MSYLIWIDLESTGLDDQIIYKKSKKLLGSEYHDILEIGIVITDKDLNPLDEGLNIVINAKKESFEKMSDYVKKMHTSNGLWDECLKSEISLNDAEEIILKYLRKHKYEKGTSPLCGNSIKLDRNFINSQMHKLKEELHYRQLDVSSYKIGAKLWNDKIFKDMTPKGNGHRALDDIFESIQEMKDYKSMFLKTSKKNEG